MRPADAGADYSGGLGCTVFSTWSHWSRALGRAQNQFSAAETLAAKQQSQAGARGHYAWCSLLFPVLNVRADGCCQDSADGCALVRHVRVGVHAKSLRGWLPGGVGGHGVRHHVYAGAGALPAGGDVHVHVFLLRASRCQ